MINEKTALAEKEGWSLDEIKLFEGDCWQHLQNIWFGAVIKQLSKTLTDLLEDDLNKIPSIFCMSTEIDDLLHIALRRNSGSQQTMQRDMGPFLRIGCKHIIRQHLYSQSFEHVVVQDKTLE